MKKQFITKEIFEEVAIVSEKKQNFDFKVNSYEIEITIPMGQRFLMHYFMDRLISSFDLDVDKVVLSFPLKAFREILLKRNGN